MTWFVDLRAESSGGSVASEVMVRRDQSVMLKPNALLDAVRGKHVLLATHGFNVNRKNGIDSLSKWSRLIDLDQEGIFVGVLWPGDSRWAPVVDYPFEGDEAMASGRLLAPFLDKHFSEVASVSFSSHSLGARMVLETISRLQLPVRRLTLMAGAINDDCLSREYKSVPPKVERISLLASRGDYVLKLAFPVVNPLAGLLSKGHPYWQGALGLDGPVRPYPETLHRKQQSDWQIPDNWDYGHLDYLGDAAAPCTASDLPPASPTLQCDKPAWSAGFVSTRFR